MKPQPTAAPAAPAAAPPDPAVAPAAATPEEAAPEEGTLEAAVAALEGKLAEEAETPAPDDAPAEEPAAEAAPAEDEPAEEPAAEEQPADEEESEPVQKGLGLLAKRERELLMREVELKPLVKQAEAYEKAKAEAARNPDAYLKAAGLTYQQVTEFYLNRGQPTPEMQQTEVQKQIAELREEIAKRDQRDAERERTKSVEAFRGRVSKFIAQGGEATELCQQEGEEAVDLVGGIIEAHYKRSGKVMAIDEAVKRAESALEQRANKYLQTKKIGGRLPPAAPKSAAPKAARSPGQKPSSVPPKTLTNRHAAPVPPPKNPDDMTDEERIAAATEYLRGRVKQSD